MAISYIGQAVGTTSATLPAHQADDLLIGFAYRDGSNTAPTVPSGWTTIGTASGANTNSSVVAYRIAPASGQVSGTWTNATSVVFLVYRGTLSGATAPIGANANTGAQSTTVTYPALTMSRTDGTSWVVGLAGHRSVNTSLENAPSGMTNRATVVDATDEAAGHDTDGGVSDWGNTNVSVAGTSSGWRARTIEILDRRSLSLVSDGVIYTAAGQDAALELSLAFAANGELITLTGLPAATIAARKLISEFTSFSYVGNDAQLSKSFNPIILSAEVAAINETGQSANLQYNRLVRSDYQSFGIIEQSAGLLQSKNVLGSKADLSLSGISSQLSKAAKLAASFGSLSTTGQSTAFSRSYQQTSASGSVSITGITTALVKGLKLSAENSALALSGQDTGLNKSLKITSSSGAYLTTGQDSTLRVGRSLSLSAGTALIQGLASNLKSDRLLSPADGSYSVTGQSASLNYIVDKTITANFAGFVLSGQAAVLLATRQPLSANNGQYNLAASPSALLSGKKLTAEGTSHNVEGRTAALLVGRKVLSNTATLTISEQPATLRAFRSVVAADGNLAITGNNAALLDSAVLLSELGNFDIAEGTAGLSLSRFISAQGTTVAISPRDADIIWTRFGDLLQINLVTELSPDILLTSNTTQLLSDSPATTSISESSYLSKLLGNSSITTNISASTYLPD